jgi:hypothetical protein
VPVGRWFYRANKEGVCIGVASDVLGDADFLPTETRLTLARATRYANDVETGPEELPWLPAVDCGELKFGLRLFTDNTAPDALTESLLAKPVTLPVPPSPGLWPAQGSLGAVTPAVIRVLSIQAGADGTVKVRVQNRGKKAVIARCMLAGKRVILGRIGPQEILTQSITT